MQDHQVMVFLGPFQVFDFGILAYLAFDSVLIVLREFGCVTTVAHLGSCCGAEARHCQASYFSAAHWGLQESYSVEVAHQVYPFVVVQTFGRQEM